VTRDQALDLAQDLLDYRVGIVEVARLVSNWLLSREARLSDALRKAHADIEAGDDPAEVLRRLDEEIRK
jgi:hypothetical protein